MNCTIVDKFGILSHLMIYWIKEYITVLCIVIFEEVCRIIEQHVHSHERIYDLLISTILN